VQVLEHEQHGAGLGQLGQHAQHRAEQLLLGQAGQVARLAGLPVGQQPGQHRPGGQGVGHRAAGGRAGDRVPQRVGQREVGHGVGELGAVAGQHGEALAGRPPGQLGDQPGLAHAGVAADQHDNGLAGLGLGQQGGQAAQLGGTADQRRPGRVGHGIPRV
jgi:hypothetical protein